MRRNALALCFAASLVTALAGPALAANFTAYDDGPDFVNALFGAPVGTVHVQDFDGYAHDTDLDGVAFLPGVSASSNLDAIVAFGPTDDGDRVLFAISREDPNERQAGDAFVTFSLAAPYLAIGFQLASWDPQSLGAAVARVDFLDGTFAELERFPTNAVESDPSFFGVISDTPIVSVTWFENGESFDASVNEGVAFDDFVVAEVPEPGTLLLLARGLAALARRRPR